MEKPFNEVIQGYLTFKDKYVTGDNSIMEHLAYEGQSPEIMIVSCCDSRVDPAIILQCEPGDLFITRNVANIVPPFEADMMHHGTSAALEFGVCYLNVKHLIILGHSQCGGINAILHEETLSKQNDFITNWVSLVKPTESVKDVDTLAKKALFTSYENCMSFPWIVDRVSQKKLAIHLWYFDIKSGEMLAYSFDKKGYQPLALEAATG